MSESTAGPDAVDDALSVSASVSLGDWNKPGARHGILRAAEALAAVWPDLPENDPRWGMVTVRLAAFRTALHVGGDTSPANRDAAIACHRRLVPHPGVAPVVEGWSRLALGLLLMFRAMPNQMATTIQGAVPGAHEGFVPGMDMLQAMGPMGAPGPPGGAADLAAAEAYLRPLTDEERFPPEHRSMASNLLMMVKLLRALRGDAPMGEAMALIGEMSTSWSTGAPGGVEMEALATLAFNAVNTTSAASVIDAEPVTEPENRIESSAIEDLTAAVGEGPTGSSGHPQTLRRLTDQLLTGLPEAADDAEIDDLVSRAAAVCGRPGATGRDRLLLGLALAYRARSGGRADDRDSAIAELRRAAAELSPDDPAAPAPVEMLGVLLVDRFALSGALDDADDVARDLRRTSVAAPDSEAPPMLDALYGYGALCDGLARRDLVALTDAVTALERARTTLPQNSPWRFGIETALAVATLARAAARADEYGLRRAAEDIERLSADGPTEPVRARAGLAMVLRGLLTGDDAVAGAGLATLDAGGRQSRFRYVVALAHLVRNTPDAAARLDAVLESDGAVPTARFLWGIAAMHSAHGDHRRALTCGIAGLQRVVDDVVRRAGTDQALDIARAIAERAAAVAVAALHGAAQNGDDSLTPLAIEALEQGRGALGYAAGTPFTVNESLRHLGLDDLARDWEQTGRQPWMVPWAEIPAPIAVADLGLFGFANQEDAPILAVLPRPVTPTVDTIADALRDVSADALVYLVPGTADAPGCAIVVRATGETVNWSLPELTTGASTGYLRSVDRARTTNRWDDWEPDLVAVCGWAGTAVMEPLLTRAADWGLDHPVRLVLVPCGSLGLVPWHAATDSTGRHACQHVVISYASSAAQFVAARRRGTRPPTDEPLLVADPCGAAIWSRLGVRATADLYPDAALGGSSDDAEPVDGALAEVVLDRLVGGDRPPASLLQFGGPAWSSAVPTRSYLAFGSDPDKASAWLSLDRVLRRTERRSAQPPGGTIVLPNCRSDVYATEYDDAIGIPSTFLAAGASAVISAQWPVPELQATIFLCVFHHFLRQDPNNPADAVRAAQLWMLDPERTPTPGLPDVLADEVRCSAQDTSDDRLDFASPSGWAAFSVH